MSESTPGVQWVLPGYRQVSELGTGGSGRVVLAVHEASGTQVALKYLSPMLLSDLRFVERFRAEARLLAGLRDPHLVRFFDYVESPYGAVIVMEFVPGVSLRSVLKQCGAMAPEAALVVLKGSLLGLAAAHGAGVVHRDYKPENVLVAGDGASKLADFGVAVPVGQDAGFAGTPAYMAPEQWAGGAVSPAADVYAATVVFFECLAGAKPYQATTLDDWAKAHRTAQVPTQAVPQPVRGLVAHGMAKQPTQRPASAAAFVEELEQAARAGYGDDWERRGRRALAALVAGLLALVPGQLTDQRPAEPPDGFFEPGKMDLLRPRLGGFLTKPVLLPILGVLVVVIVVGTVIVKPGEDRTEPRSDRSPASSPFTTPSEAPTGDDVIIIIRDRMSKLGTANFVYDEIGCCSQQLWANGRLDHADGGSSVAAARVFDGSEAFLMTPTRLKANEKKFGKTPKNQLIYDRQRKAYAYFREPQARAATLATRSMVVGKRAYVDAGGGWQSFRTADVEEPREYAAGPRPRKVAGQSVQVQRMAAPEHIVELIENSDGARPSTEGDTITYRGTTTAQEMGYEGSAKVTFRVELGPDYLPKRLVERYHTPGGNTPYVESTTVYSGWGEADPVAAP